jgi:PAS domain S-box-containing protein
VPPELFANTLNTLPLAVWVVDDAGGVVFANPASTAVLGYEDPSELVGRRGHEVVHYKHPDGRPYPAAECSLLHSVLTGTASHGTAEWVVRRDGTMVPVDWWSAPMGLADSAGTVISFAASAVHDAGERAARRRALNNEETFRRRLAQDLHEGAQQRLVNLLIVLQLAGEELLATGEPVSSLIDEARGHAQGAVEDLRTLAARLHPAILKTRGLGAAVGSLAAGAPLPVTLSSTLKQRLPASLESQAYYFVTDALARIVEHSRATSVEISIWTDASSLFVEVRDHGMSVASVSGSDGGLAMLADRVEGLDGAFEIDAQEGAATTVRAELPLSPLAGSSST